MCSLLGFVSLATSTLRVYTFVFSGERWAIGLKTQGFTTHKYEGAKTHCSANIIFKPNPSDVSASIATTCGHIGWLDT
jgi:hypothetical protein